MIELEEGSWKKEEILEATGTPQEYGFEEFETYLLYIKTALEPMPGEELIEFNDHEDALCPECEENLDENYREKMKFSEDDSEHEHILEYICEDHGVVMSYIEKEGV